ncbi:hypothetical protein [Bacillus sp. B1-b2]|uniref:hypothetical protein n=1 Tax=Bacillus sp. B1-b2 TaxID=2653201 RepID=UPI00126171E7|nr:hypothetical protein [Bacillus sp. B1-b2]KAB7664314.1 hypothetical protein F9279_23045 [Bacillus sp. B1-b2]
MKKILYAMIMIPWLSIPFLGIPSLKRFLPGALTMSMYLVLEGRLAEKRKWWWFPFTVKPNVLGELPLIFGPFLVGSLWILKYTYGKKYIYLLVNLLVDTFFSFIVTGWLKKLGYVTLIRLSKFQLSIVFLIKTVVLYLSQFLFEKFYKKTY